MTVALRFALRRSPDAEAGALLTIVPALAVTLPFVAAQSIDLERDLAVPARGAARPGPLPAPLHARGARRRPVAHVGGGRDGAALLGRDRADLPRRAAAGGPRPRRAPDRRRRRAARRRAGAARAREADRPRARALARRSSSPCATTSCAGSRSTPTSRPRSPPRRRSAPAACASPPTCSRPGAVASRSAGLPRVRARRACSSGSPTSASSRPTTAVRVTVVSPLVATESLWGVGLSALLLRRSRARRAAPARWRRARRRGRRADRRLPVVRSATLSLRFS